MLIIPTSPVPAQVIQAPLGEQNCTLTIYQLDTGLFIDVLISAAGGVLMPIVYGVLCLNLNLIVRSAYLGFVGDFAWIDNQASVPTAGQDPNYLGLGSQFSLAYLSPSDLPAGLGVGVS